MSKRSATSEIAPKARIKRATPADLVRQYLDTEADVASEGEGTEDEGGKSLGSCLYLHLSYLPIQRTAPS
jgi:hypothetical protein